MGLSVCDAVLIISIEEGAELTFNSVGAELTCNSVGGVTTTVVTVDCLLISLVRATCLLCSISSAVRMALHLAICGTK